MRHDWKAYLEAIDAQGRWVPRLISSVEDLPEEAPEQVPARPTAKARMTAKRALAIIDAVVFKHAQEVVGQADLGPDQMRHYLGRRLRADGVPEAEDVIRWLQRSRGTPLAPELAMLLHGLPGWPRSQVSSGKGFGDFVTSRDQVGIPDQAGLTGDDRPAEQAVVDKIADALKKTGDEHSPEVRAAMTAVWRDRERMLRLAKDKAKWHADPGSPDPATVIKYWPVEERIEFIKKADKTGPEPFPYCYRVIARAAEALHLDEPMQLVKRLANGEAGRNEDIDRAVEKAIAMVNTPDEARHKAVLDAEEFFQLVASGRVNLSTLNHQSHILGYIDDASFANQGRDLARGSGIIPMNIQVSKR